MFLAERYTELAAEIVDCTRQRAEDCQDARHSSDIRILLVTKYQSQANIFSTLDYFSSTASLMQPNWGESYVQGVVSRYCELKTYYHEKVAIDFPKLELIGPLQSNKVTKALKYCSALHSVSTIKLLQCLEAACCKNESSAANYTGRLPIFFQYNASDEPQKNGCRNYDELRQLTDILLSSQHLCLQGIMCMSQAGSDEVTNRRCFARARELASRLWRDYPPNRSGARSLGAQVTACWHPAFRFPWA